MESLSTTQVFDGKLIKYKFFSKALNATTQFNVFYPKKHKSTLLFLSGLTCTENNFMEKSGGIRVAAELEMAIITPDTSPRNVNCKNDTDHWDFGQGAGYYLDATTDAYKHHYNMNSFIFELISLFDSLHLNKPIHISGHSMGGMGALCFALKNPDVFTSVSAFAPVCHPIHCPWGQKAFSAFLGPNTNNQWQQYDPTCLATYFKNKKTLHILIDQGTEDAFLESQLVPNAFIHAAASNNHLQLTHHFREGYDHSYYFIATFITSHLQFHAQHR